MFTLGSIGFLHELVWQTGERPWVLAMSGYMMGLPFLIAADRLPRTLIRQDADDEDDDDPWSHLPRSS